jgi:3-deoxy-7-phosphoheptulonate synthase
MPVLLKRGPSATMDKFLLAAVYILKTGKSRVMLCERGIRTFEDHTRFTPPPASVLYLHQTTHLPVVVDPNHGTGKATLAATMAVAAVAAGADGLMVELHPDPEKALSDGFQALTPRDFRKMVADCRKVADAVGLRI